MGKVIALLVFLCGAAFAQYTPPPGGGVYTVNSLGTTPTDAIKVVNTTAAAVGAQQVSPNIHWQGQGWGTTGASSQNIDFRSYLLPVQSTVPTGIFEVDAAINGGAYANFIAIGSNAKLRATDTNTFMGVGVSNGVLTGTVNTCIGYFSCNAITNSINNTAIGAEALQSLTTGGGSNGNNTAVGLNAMQLATTASTNTAIGVDALQHLTTSTDNTAIGFQALANAPTAQANTAAGSGAMLYARVPSYTVAVGEHSLYQTETANYAVALGSAALYNISNGTGQIGIGYIADGFVPPDGWTLTATSGSGLTAGVYLYKMAYILGSIQSELSQGITNTVTTAGGNLQVTVGSIPAYTGPVACTNIALYRTKVNVAAGNQTWFLVTNSIACSGGSYVDSTADASLVTQDPTLAPFLAVGYMPNPSDRTCLEGQACFGSISGPLNQWYIGQGAFSATPATNVFLNVTGGQGTNVAGSNLVLGGGVGTGTALSGATIIQAAAAGSSGIAGNALSTVATFTAANITLIPLKTTGAATGKTIVCVDTATGILYASTSGVACAN